MNKKIAGLTLSAVLFILYSMLLAPCSSAEAQQAAKIPRVGFFSLAAATNRIWNRLSKA
jgi:hypothetical protein